MAVALAMPLVLPVALPAPAVAQQVPLVPAQVTAPGVLAQNASPAQAALAGAVDQFKAGQYEEALTALQAIQADGLADADKALLASTITEAEQASQLRRGARADFEKAQALLASGDNVEATNLYKSVAANQYADEGTKAKAREQIALAQTNVAGQEQDSKGLYESAVADYKADNFTAARPKFQQLLDAGYKPGWFEKSPREYVELIEKKQAGPAPT